jgi:hypothetical protein
MMGKAAPAPILVERLVYRFAEVYKRGQTTSGILPVFFGTASGL